MQIKNAVNLIMMIDHDKKNGAKINTEYHT